MRYSCSCIACRCRRHLCESLAQHVYHAMACVSLMCLPCVSLMCLPCVSLMCLPCVSAMSSHVMHVACGMWHVACQVSQGMRGCGGQARQKRREEERCGHQERASSQPSQVFFFSPAHQPHPVAGGSHGHLEYWAHSGLIDFLEQLVYRVTTAVQPLCSLARTRPRKRHTVNTQTVNRVSWSAPVICVAQLFALVQNTRSTMLALVSHIYNVARLSSFVYLLSFKLRHRENACGSVGVSVSCLSVSGGGGDNEVSVRVFGL